MSKDERREEELPEAKLVLGNELLGGGNTLSLKVLEAVSEDISNRISVLISETHKEREGGWLFNQFASANTETLANDIAAPVLFRDDSLVAAAANRVLGNLSDTSSEQNGSMVDAAALDSKKKPGVAELPPILKENFDKLFNEVFNGDKILFLDEVLALPDEVLLTTFFNSHHTKFSAHLNAIAKLTCGEAYGGPLFQKFSSLLGKLNECSGGVVSAILAKPTPAEFDHRALLSGPLTVNEKPTDPDNDVTNLGGENPDQDN